jgi:hypothetical protein
MPGNINDPDLLSAGQINPSETKIDGHLALLFFLQSIGVSAG